MNLFNQNYSNFKIEEIFIQDGKLYFIENFINIDESYKLYKKFIETIQWKNDEVSLFGKQYVLDRKSAMYSSINADYFYAGKNHKSLPFNNDIIKIIRKIERLTPNLNFNSVLFNWYKNGTEKMGWHSDNEKELGDNPHIASLSLGAERRFDLRHKKDKANTLKLQLPSGSLLIMGEGIQENYKHQLPAQKKILEGRINLTFRKMII